MENTKTRYIIRCTIWLLVENFVVITDLPTSESFFNKNVFCKKNDDFNITALKLFSNFVSDVR